MKQERRADASAPAVGQEGNEGQCYRGQARLQHNAKGQVASTPAASSGMDTPNLLVAVP